ncbi:MAG: D-alanine--D-alanine ligase [Nitrospirae bacterium GWF2_44_13]|nr:MAG: D-alanine--D-alanine ligase [Nitrospirae bacterium GWF2_44_13]OGW66194.1 MAG: D-alanine--D-alanine ligase [Nitrospirae bacterium RIFOXYA2_FULL_44_9]OGW71556.1 MAG: D-alanine--D-alanine ligase [Nitrospirae bacterium RIFOXYC2_FULL_44_7]HBG93684.1 D-alanine--D-alanine ligase [Nitrospiraceae bacterium]
MLTNKKIGVLMGGISSEREVSLRSGSAVFNALKKLGYTAVAIDAASNICEMLKKEKIDIAFLVLHGGWGEDGSIQGLLEVMGIPYTGSDVISSAIAMNKAASKKIFLYHKIPVPPFIVLDKKAVSYQLSAISFEMPWVVKPAGEGSSVGVSIVRDKGQIESALKTGFSCGSEIIIEKYIEGREIHIGILNDRALGGVEVKTSLEFYSYEAKYTAGLTEYILPPQIDEAVYMKAKDIALSANRALGCLGATRVDLKIDNDGNPYVLEVNTIPGMTETSLLPKIAKEAGLDFPALVEEILKGAIEREQRRHYEE